MTVLVTVARVANGASIGLATQSAAPLACLAAVTKSMVAVEGECGRQAKADVAVLLVDHQTGLTNLVHDFSPDDFKNNVLALADAAKYFQLSTILTTSFEEGPNGPLVPELKELFAVTDASGTFNQTKREAAWSRMAAAGVQLMTWFGTACELKTFKGSLLCEKRIAK